MPRFVVLLHDHPFPHWDLMLEAGPALRTWRLHERPDTQAAVRAEPLPDHRLEYLTYEGPVSGGRGTVRQWDAGAYVLEGESPHRIAIRLSGGQLCGRAVLDRSESPARWIYQAGPAGLLGG